MSAPSPAYSTYQSGPPPPPAPPTPVWIPGVRSDAGALASLLLRGLGFFLLFLASLIVVGAYSPPGGCVFTPQQCGPAWLSSAWTWIIVGKVLAVIGAGFLGLGTAIKMHFGLKMPGPGRPEDAAWIAAERRVNGMLFALSIIILFVLMITVNALPPVALP